MSNEVIAKVTDSKRPRLYVVIGLPFDQSGKVWGLSNGYVEKPVDGSKGRQIAIIPASDELLTPQADPTEAIARKFGWVEGKESAGDFIEGIAKAGGEQLGKLAMERHELQGLRAECGRLGIATAERDSLRTQLTNEEENYNLATNEIDRLINKNRTQESEITGLKQQLDQVREVADRREKKLDDQCVEITRLKAENATLRKYVNSDVEDDAAAKSACLKHGLKWDESSVIVMNAQDGIDLLDAEITRLNGCYDAYQRDITKYKGERDGAEARWDEQGKEITRLESENAKLDENYKGMEHALRKQEGFAKHLLEKFESYKSRLNEVHKNLAASEVPFYEACKSLRTLLLDTPVTPESSP